MVNVLKTSCVKTGDQVGPMTPEEQVMSRAVIVLSCASYRNQVLHVFLRPSLLATAVQTAASNNKRMRT